jgi:hypothetical protein
VISLTDDVCGGAILDIDSVSVLDVVFMLGVVTRNCSAEIANLGAFFVTHSRSNAFLTPYVLMACKPVEARERLPSKVKVDMLKASHGSCRRRRDGNHLRSLRLGLGLFSLRFSAFIFLAPFVIGVSAKQVDKQC